MKTGIKKHFTEQQSAFAPPQAALGTVVAEITGKMSICEETFYRWNMILSPVVTPVQHLARTSSITVLLRLITGLFPLARAKYRSQAGAAYFISRRASRSSISVKASRV